MSDGEIAQLETFDAPETSGSRVYTFKTDELTAQCPFDFGGPDYYDLTIVYVPANRAIESKSLKKFLEGFREREITAEALAGEIYDTVLEVARPANLYVGLEQARRGGIEETVEVGNRELRV